MSTPRLEIDLDKIFHNASTLVWRLKRRGIAITGVTKACAGSSKYAATLLDAGIRTLGDSRIENIETMRRAGITAPFTLIRSPMLSQVSRVVAHAEASYNTELDVISALSDAAGAIGTRHGVLLMVELGDLREGIMPDQLEATVRRMLRFAHIDLLGIGANLACFSGVVPNDRNMRELSHMADNLDQQPSAVTGSTSRVVSGGNSSNLGWAFDRNSSVGRINDMRLGEAILLGVDPLHLTPIDGLHTDAVTMFAEVIESSVKPSRPWGQIARSTFEQSSTDHQLGCETRTILAIGHQDVDPDGITALDGSEILGASSDHLIISARGGGARIGTEVAFALNYSALLRAMTSAYVVKDFQGRRDLQTTEERERGAADRMLA